MKIILNVFFLLGGITVFLLGLKNISGGAERIRQNKLTSFLNKGAKHPVIGLLSGCIITSVVQSSTAINIAAITLVDKGILSFQSASAIVLGTNIGTTITAQLVSLTSLNSKFIEGIFCLISFIGFVISNVKFNKNYMGNILMGTGLIFIGINLLTSSVENFKEYQWFNNLFLIKNPIVLLLNGCFLTAIIHSSSAITSVIVLLSTLKLMNFENAGFIILGANIGSCIPVIFQSFPMGENSRKVAIFNLCFNLFGSLAFFIPMCILFKYKNIPFILNILSRGNIARQIANFHSFFNIVTSLIVLPFLNVFCSFSEKVYNIIFKDTKKCNFIKRKIKAIKEK